MEVLKPQLVWIGNRCYRKNPVKESGFNPEDEELENYNDAPNDFTYCDELCDAGLNIEETDQGYRLKIEVPNVFFKYIIGKKGETKRRLEAETRTNIVIPKLGDNKDEIIIQCHDKKGIVSAKTRLDVMIDSARQKQQFTHFLSIPVTNDKVQEGFEDFKFEILNQCEGDRGLDCSLFQKREKLHMTIGTLVLLNDTEIKKAKDLLDDCQQELVEPILRSERLDVLIQGLEYMNDDPGAVDVLYAKVEPGTACERLQVLADRLVDKFTSSGLMQREFGDHVKLHVTVMNTLFRKDPDGAEVPKPERQAPQSSQRGGSNSKPRESFDASQILKRFGKFKFGPLHVSTIHLSQRHSTGMDGYYSEAACVSLPS